MDKILKVLFAIIATLIGAGFASGQEINTFFFKYGIYGIAGLLICTVLLAYIIYKAFKIVQTHQIESYSELINYLIKKQSNRKYLNLSFIINTIVNLFLMVTFFIMIAGFGAFFSQELGISKYLGSSILSVVCLIAFISSTEGVVKISSIIVPILIFFIIIIGAINFNQLDFNYAYEKLNNFKEYSYSWILSSILYCSYNCILLIPMLIPLQKYLNRTSVVVIVSFLSGIVIFVLALSIFGLLIKCNIAISTLEMPVLYVIGKFYPSFRNIYALVILASIYTTAISIGMSLLANITSNKKSQTFFALFLCIAGLFVSCFGFSALVGLFYPVFGILGLLQIILIIKFNKFYTNFVK